MPKKSKPKSSKKRKSSKHSNLKSSKNVNVTEVNASTNHCSDNDRKASTHFKSRDFSFAEIDTPTNFKLGSLGEFLSGNRKSKSCELLERVKWVELPKRSESIIPILRSELNEIVTRSLVRSKSTEPLKSPKVEPLLRKSLSEPIESPELSEWTVGLLCTKLVRDRRSCFQRVFNSANDVVEYMFFLDNERESSIEFMQKQNNRWKQKDASDWFDFLKLWQDTPDDIQGFLDVLEDIYGGNFDINEHISITISEFTSFTKDLEDITEKIQLLLKRCTNCVHKYNRFAKTDKELEFIRDVSNYRRKITYLYKKIKVELCQFDSMLWYLYRT